MSGVRIDIWADVVCPWCYLGKRRLESALSSLPEPDASDVEIVWHSFQLDPGAPSTPEETIPEMLGRKFGGGVEAGLAMIDRVDGLAAAEGLVLRQHEARRTNSLDAHRLLHLARADGPETQGALQEAVFAAYFTRTENIADHGTLRRLGVGVGLDAGRIDEVLGSEEYLPEVQADLAQARALGIPGVPFFVVDQRYAVSGAQPTEVFRQVVDAARGDSDLSVAR